MNKIISKTIKINSKQMPPKTDFIENEIIKQKIEPLRWSIVDIKENELSILVSGRELN